MCGLDKQGWILGEKCKRGGNHQRSKSLTEMKQSTCPMVLLTVIDLLWWRVNSFVSCSPKPPTRILVSTHLHGNLPLFLQPCLGGNGFQPEGSLGMIPKTPKVVDNRAFWVTIEHSPPRGVTWVMLRSAHSVLFVNPIQPKHNTNSNFMNPHWLMLFQLFSAESFVSTRHCSIARVDRLPYMCTWWVLGVSLSPRGG